MSDYLWDKTGEPDAETERIENLLGQLRFQPTPFDLPAELPAREFRAPRARLLSWPRLALAASLTLAVLAGAWVMLKQQAGTTDGGRQVAAHDNRAKAGEKDSTVATPKATEGPTENNAGEGKGNETPAAPSRGNGKRREERAGGRVRPRRPDLAVNRARRLPRVETPRREERAALTDEEREAAEKVLYALRITSEKLNYARQQVQETGRNEENR